MEFFAIITRQVSMQWEVGAGQDFRGCTRVEWSFSGGLRGFCG